MTTTPEDAAALFDLPPPAASPPATASTVDDLDAAEAALMAELAAELELGAVADAPDSRSDRRVDVAWPARMRLPDGSVVELQVRNVSQGGVGLVSEHPIPAWTVVAFEMDVPPLADGDDFALVQGTLKTTYTVAQGSATLCGGTWQGPPAGLARVVSWVGRLWR